MNNNSTEVEKTNLKALIEEIEFFSPKKFDNRLYKSGSIICILGVLIASSIFITFQFTSNNEKTEQDKVLVMEKPKNSQLIVIKQQDDKSNYEVNKVENLPAMNTTISKVNYVDDVLLYVCFLIIVIITLCGSLALLLKTLKSESEMNNKFNDLEKDLIKECMMWKITRIKKE